MMLLEMCVAKLASGDRRLLGGGGSALEGALLQLAEGFPHHADDASCVGEGVAFI